MQTETGLPSLEFTHPTQTDRCRTNLNNKYAQYSVLDCSIVGTRGQRPLGESCLIEYYSIRIKQGFELTTNPSMLRHWSDDLKCACDSVIQWSRKDEIQVGQFSHSLHFSPPLHRKSMLAIYGNSMWFVFMHTRRSSSAKFVFSSVSGESHPATQLISSCRVAEY